MGIFLGDLFTGGNFPGSNFLGGIFPGDFFHGGFFPDTKLRVATFTEVGFERFLFMNKISPSGFTVSLTVSLT